MPDGGGRRPHVVVVGGGITGLATAWYLRNDADVTVVDAADRLGGKIRTEELAGVPVEAGPDTFLARVPDATRLCRDLGLGPDLVEPATGKAFVWTRGRLRPLPSDQVLGVPVALRPLLRSGVLPPLAVARAGLDLVLPRSRFSDDPTVAEVVGRRMGRGVLHRLVEPLVGGINAGRADDLSLAATAPQLAAAAAGRSLVLELRRRRRDDPGPAGPVFLGIEGGMGRLVDRLVAELQAAGVCLLRDTSVTSVEPGFRVVTEGTPTVPDAAAVVVTLPAHGAARVLAATAPKTAGELAAIQYASVAVATMAYRPEAVPTRLEGAGFLVPRVEGRLMTACTFSTTKWPSLAASGQVMLRASAGRAGDDRPRHLDDDELVARLHLELAEAVGVTEVPVASFVTRWPHGFPQYRPGHVRRVDRIESYLGVELPGVLLAGAAYRGLGIAACIRQAEEAAAIVRRHIA